MLTITYNGDFETWIAVIGCIDVALILEVTLGVIDI